MTLFLIVVTIAVLAIAKLWLSQRRARGNVSTIDGFRSSLEKLSEPVSPEDAWAPEAQPKRVVSVDPPPIDIGSALESPSLDLPALTDERRAAAKERIAERRRAARARALT